MAFKMKGHSLPGPYQKKGDPVPKKMDKIKSEPLISPAEHAKNARGYHKDVAYHPGGYGKMGSLSKPSGWTASGKVSTESGHRRKDIAASASTVDKRFSTAKDKKSLKRAPLKKKGDPKKGNKGPGGDVKNLIRDLKNYKSKTPGGDVNVLLRDLKNYKTGKPGKAMTKSVKKKNKA